MSRAEIAAYLRISKVTVTDWMKKSLPYKRMHGRVYFDADQFYRQSAINFLTSIIYFFSKYEHGKYSTLPHVLSFLNQDYKSMFNVLFSEKELESMLSPCKSVFQQKAFDQLEGQVGTLKINLS